MVSREDFIDTEQLRVDNDKTIDKSYLMAKSYDKTRTKWDAIDLVKDEFPDANVYELESMWHAIDAYVDSNSI